MPAKQRTHWQYLASSQSRQAAPAVEHSILQDQQQTHLSLLSRRATLDPRALSPREVLHLQRALGNQVVGRLLARSTEDQTVEDSTTGTGRRALLQRISARRLQRVKIAGETKSAIFLAVKVGGDRYDETLDIIKSLGDEDFASLDLLRERVDALLPARGVWLGSKSVAIIGVGQRFDAHIPLAKSVAYIRKYRNEITPGEKQSLKVGEGRTEGYGTHGQILYNFDGATIEIYHAHDSGKMG